MPWYSATHGIRRMHFHTVVLPTTGAALPSCLLCTISHSSTDLLPTAHQSNSEENVSRTDYLDVLPGKDFGTTIMWSETFSLRMQAVPLLRACSLATEAALKHIDVPSSTTCCPQPNACRSFHRVVSLSKGKNYTFTHPACYIVNSNFAFILGQPFYLYGSQIEALLWS